MALKGSAEGNAAGAGGCSLWDAAGHPGEALTSSLQPPSLGEKQHILLSILLLCSEQLKTLPVGSEG